MKLNLKFGEKTINVESVDNAGIDAFTKTDALVNEPVRIESTADDKSAPDEILCQNCGKLPRLNPAALLCATCTAIGVTNLKRPPVAPMIDAKVMESVKLDGVRQIQFAPVSVRYSGKELDEIAIATMPALPDDLKLQLKQAAVLHTREDVIQNNPSIMDLECRAEYLRQQLAIIEALARREKDKLIIKLKPEIKKRDAELKEKAKAEKVQKSLPKDVKFVHAANVLIAAHAELTAPVDKALQNSLKRFLDHVSLEAQVEGEITAEWLKAQLNKNVYAALRAYFKFKK